MRVRLFYSDVCPECGGDMHRSRTRGIVEKIQSRLFRIQAFRCHRCGARYMVKPAVLLPARRKDGHMKARMAPLGPDEVSSHSDQSA